MIRDSVERESGMPLSFRLPPPCISPWGKGPALGLGYLVKRTVRFRG